MKMGNTASNDLATQGLIIDVLENGHEIRNKRTGEVCHTLVNEILQYNLEQGHSTLLSSKCSYPVSATAELIGYLRGYTNAQQFADIGAKTWFANANENKAWLANPHRKGENDMGKVYGAIGRDFGGIDQLQKIYNNLKNGVDDRGEILTFWKPDEFDKGCLRPCMHTHQFSSLNNKLYLNSTSRSVDVGCGLNFNSIQCEVFLKLMAKITGHEIGNCLHNLVNVHIYDKHVENIKKQLSYCGEFVDASIEIADWVKTLDDIIGNDRHARDFIVVNYKCPSEKLSFELIP